MSNLIVCCDGTWNTPDQEHDGVPVPSNVVRFYNAVAEPDGPGDLPQIKYYHPGVGAEGNWLQKAAGGAVGVGLGKNIQSAYRWLCGRYHPGDRIFLFGFSRGAFTVRCLGGMIGRCGLLDLSGLSDQEVWKRVEAAYQKGYREKVAYADRPQWAGNWPFHSSGVGDGVVGVHFVGVWDTVGALGIPNDLALMDLLDRRRNYTFHDTRLGEGVLHARHAVALDEVRASFEPTLWTDENDLPIGVAEDPATGRSHKQIWFPGVHGDVGGGYPEKGLSDGALKWMMEEAEACGLVIQPQFKDQVRPDFRDVLHRSVTGIYKTLRTQPRSIPHLGSQPPAPAIHHSAQDRMKSPPIAQAPYHCSFELATPGASKEFPVYAKPRWGETGIFLEGGVAYRFEAEGQWLDRTISCGPGGCEENLFHPAELAHLAGSLLGKLEGVWNELRGNKGADFLGSKREEAFPWFALVGAVANCGNPESDGTPAGHETFLIGEGCARTPERSGYLYCFANDSWHFYDNNRGSVALKVTRL